MALNRKLILLAVASSFAGLTHASAVKETSETIYKPDGKGGAVVNMDIAPANRAQAQAQVRYARSTGNLTYQGGPVMTAPKNMYYIWYGTTWDAASQNTLTVLGKNIGGSPYFNINSTYYDKAGTHIQNVVNYVSAISDTGSFGTQLTDANIASIVSNAITSGKLPSDANGVYMVLGDKNTNATSGFCTKYCGWHTNQTVAGVSIKYAFIGDGETQCATGCGVNSVSPNGTPGADGMASILAHELEETATDPLGNAWYSSSSGMENGDKCAWNFGSTKIASNGATYNQTIGGLNYLIQQNWTLLPSQACAQHYP